MASPQDLVIESTDFVDDQKTSHKEQGRNLLIVRNHVIISNILLCHTSQLAFRWERNFLSSCCQSRILS